MNVTCLAENRRYHHSVPLFLHNKPRHFVVHCLDRLPPKVLKISSSQITSTTEGFLIRSPDSGNDYRISIGNDKPSSYGWEFMPNAYTSQPVFNLDTDFQTSYIMFNDKTLLKIEGILQTVDSIHPNYQDCQLNINLLGGEGQLLCGQEQQLFPGFDLTPYENEVDNVWSQNMTTDTIRGKCGPFIISDTSIHQLKTFLSDEVLDSYLYLLSKVFTGVYHIDAVVFTAIVNSAETLHGLMRGVRIYDYEYIVDALHEGGNHWWTLVVETRPHAKQKDGQSCGIYILKFAENFLSGLSLQFNLTTEDNIIYRRRLGAFLLLQIDSTAEEVKENENGMGHQKDQSGAPTESCTRLYNTGQIQRRLYWSCATCERNFHPQCLGYSENSVKPVDFHCPECELSPVKTLKRKRYSVNIDKETEQMEDDGEITDNKEISDYKEMQDDEDFTDNEKVQGYHKTDSESEVEYDDDFNLEFADFECSWLDLFIDMSIMSPIQCSWLDLFIDMSIMPPIQCSWLDLFIDMSIMSPIQCSWLDLFIDMSIMSPIQCSWLDLFIDMSIMSTIQCSCDEVEHERHHEFVSAPQKVYNRERRTVAFGCEVVNQKIINALHKYLIQNLVYNHKEPFRFGGRRIINLRNSNLQQIFIQYKMMADHYVTYVLHKEAIIYLKQRKSGCPYEAANERCVNSEVDFNKELKRMRSK
ncbi:unnamed protein product [Mytilus coruscus]|uniref:Ubiquitin-like protease family profile domain-containing protein n=1 Tax=Mytilus coruscus TaxID=42192 RepID=A0A6J8E8S5_MYTCO|nr:unnamed protein product [Mytilus coruscus]